MSTIVPSSSKGEGNTSPPPKVKQISPSIRWAFTFNNYNKDQEDNIRSICSSICRYAVCGKEVGESGTPHLQGYIEFKSKKRPKSAFDYPMIHWEKAKGTKEENRIYCTKSGDFWEIGGKKPLRPLKCEDPDDQYDWQKCIIEIIKEEPNDRDIHWFIGSDGGEGKTEFCKYLVRYHGALLSGGKCSDMKNGIVEYYKVKDDTPELIIINVPKSFDKEYLSYTGIEEVKDMLFYSGKYEGKPIEGNRPHVFVFSNEFPNLDKLSKDRWKIYKINYGWVDINSEDSDDPFEELLD